LIGAGFGALHGLDQRNPYTKNNSIFTAILKPQSCEILAR